MALSLLMAGFLDKLNDTPVPPPCLVMENARRRFLAWVLPRTRLRIWGGGWTATSEDGEGEREEGAGVVGSSDKAGGGGGGGNKGATTVGVISGNGKSSSSNSKLGEYLDQNLCFTNYQNNTFLNLMFIAKSKKLSLHRYYHNNKPAKSFSKIF